MYFLTRYIKNVLHIVHFATCNDPKNLLNNLFKGENIISQIIQYCIKNFKQCMMTSKSSTNINKIIYLIEEYKTWWECKPFNKI